MPNVPRNPREEFNQARIPGARFFDLDDVIDKSSPFPHMLPSAEDFARAAGMQLLTLCLTQVTLASLLG
jgi:thiosulfate/3-mercaptopyruvate sulfurtransferase